MITDRRAKGGIEKVKRTLRIKLQGWFNYFKDAIPVTWMTRVDEWLRRRIRQLLWKQWKKPENRHREFAKRLTKCPSLEEYAYGSNSYWRMARTPLINKALSIKNLENEGWVSLKGLDSASI